MEKHTGFKHFIKAFGYSLQGFKSAFKSEAAFRQEFILALVLIPLGLWLGETGGEKALLVASVLLLLLIELLNSAIEAVVDRIGTEYHELAGKAKDLGSAAVFIAVLILLSVWGCILIW
ncbi:diacylglycerol kinase [Psittacicella melopsittaci]|uniref:Diacylglycerol kinase n=1 Tax=Psittacicella melopsittaci TaxID=2028576 RepID=A0A3A1Y688_9GAMM|nr:diacylglycerol kinase [Psittacicella melopsittaci]RIY32806.1 diacylglycerol kinase [Psittacicella melopsittaci]